MMKELLLRIVKKFSGLMPSRFPTATAKRGGWATATAVLSPSLATWEAIRLSKWWLGLAGERLDWVTTSRMINNSSVSGHYTVTDVHHCS